MLSAEINEKFNVIVLVDEEEITDFTELVLTGLGIEQVSSFTSLKSFTDSKVIDNADLIFIDTNLKDINELILLAWVKAKRPTVAVIMFWADTRLELIQ